MNSHTEIRVLVSPVDDPRWDARVTVLRLSDGRVRTDLISGGQQLIDATTRRLIMDLDNLYEF